MMKRNILTTLLFFFCLTLYAQISVVIKGKVSDENGQAIPNVSIIQSGTNNATISNQKGYYTLEVEFSDSCVLEFRNISYATQFSTFYITNKTRIFKDVTLQLNENKIENVDITATRPNDATSTIKAKDVEYFPSPTNDVGAVVKTLGQGVQSNNELSGQYNVRGGNYDENLVYVNDFEIYRPFLISSGQQEGLSFTNLDLTDKLSFSGGGFEAKYGDKMSSVLDIKYKSPTEFHGSVMASILGVNAHVEGAAYAKKDSFKTLPKFTYLVGLRYKSNAYLLGSLDKKGEYIPNNFDIQTDFHFKPSLKHDIEILANHSYNVYNFIPVEEETRTGTFNQLIRFLVDYEGNEKDKFQNTMVGVAYKFLPNTKLSLKFMSSFWKMRESEAFNITGYYSLDEIDIDPSSDNFGNVKENLGIGAFQDWARNKLDAIVANFSHHGKYTINDKHLLEWGATFQYEQIKDELSEWQRLDSAGYSIPYSGSSIVFPYRLASTNELQSFRTHGYFQDTWNKQLKDSSTISIVSGIRYNFWNVNKEFLVSPRIQIFYHPNLKSDVTFRLTGGMYVQPPFYRDIRRFDGTINRNVKAQQSYHIVLGADYNFNIKKRPFKLTTEVYYKNLRHVNPYEIEDVRIRYFADNNAKGYATGVDVRLFGEMIKGVDSWITLSYLNTKVDILDDYYVQYKNKDGVIITPSVTDQVAVDSSIVHPGYIRRPTDQSFFMSFYFQDYIEKNKRFKVHLNLVVGTGLPFGPPDHQRYKDVFKMPPYRRLDIGFSALLLNGEKRGLKKPNSFGSKFENIWASFEVFNILGIRNTLSYRWIKDYQNNLWAIPNYLTTRRFNVKLNITW